MKHRLPKMGHPVELERHPSGGHQLLALMRPGLDGCAQVLRNALDSGYARQGQIIFHEVMQPRQLDRDFGEGLSYRLRTVQGGLTHFLLEEFDMERSGA